MSEDIPSYIAQKIIVKFLAKEGVKPNEIFTRIKYQFGIECLSLATITDYFQVHNHIAIINEEQSRESSCQNVEVKPCNHAVEHGYAAVEIKSNLEHKATKKIFFAKKFREIRPAPTQKVIPNKKIVPAKKILLPRRMICNTKVKPLINVNKPTVPVNVLITQPVQIETNIEESKNLENISSEVESNIKPIIIPIQTKGLKKIAPKISPIAIIKPITNVVTVIQNEDNSENEVPQEVDNEVIIPDILEENDCFTSYAPLAEHGYAIGLEEQEKIKHRQGKPLSSQQKILAYNTYLNDRHSKNCSKSQSIAHAAITSGIGSATMWNLVKEMEKHGQFTPPKKRTRRSTYETLDDANKIKLQKIVTQLIKNEKVATVDKIYLALREDESFPPMSRTTVYNQLKKLGFKYEKRGREKILEEKKQNSVSI